MTNSADQDQLASKRSQLIWIYTVCKGRAYLGPAGLGLKLKAVQLTQYGPCQTKKCLWTWSKCADSDHPVHSLCIVWAFALHSYILQYPVIRLASSVGPDQTAWIILDMQAYLGLHCPHMLEDTFSHGIVHMVKSVWSGSVCLDNFVKIFGIIIECREGPFVISSNCKLPFQMAWTVCSRSSLLVSSKEVVVPIGCLVWPLKCQSQQQQMTFWNIFLYFPRK